MVFLNHVHLSHRRKIENRVVCIDVLKAGVSVDLQDRARHLELICRATPSLLFLLNMDGGTGMAS